MRQNTKVRMGSECFHVTVNINNAHIIYHYETQTVNFTRLFEHK